MVANRLLAAVELALDAVRRQPGVDAEAISGDSLRMDVETVYPHITKRRGEPTRLINELRREGVL